MINEVQSTHTDEQMDESDDDMVPGTPQNTPKRIKYTPTHRNSNNNNNNLLVPPPRTCDNTHIDICSPYPTPSMSHVRHTYNNSAIPIAPMHSPPVVLHPPHPSSSIIVSPISPLPPTSSSVRPPAPILPVLSLSALAMHRHVMRPPPVVLPVPEPQPAVQMEIEPESELQIDSDYEHLSPTGTYVAGTPPPASPAFVPVFSPRRTRRVLKPKSVKQKKVKATKSTKWCICDSLPPTDTSTVHWVHCDDFDCAVGWYHWVCVGITQEPLGEWLCPTCRQ